MDPELCEIVFDNVYNGIYIVDGKGVTIRVNRPFEEMSGIYQRRTGREKPLRPGRPGEPLLGVGQPHRPRAQDAGHRHLFDQHQPPVAGQGAADLRR